MTRVAVVHTFLFLLPFLFDTGEVRAGPAVLDMCQAVCRMLV